MRLPLIGGSYVARSIIASAQRCVNLYPETNPQGSLVPVTHYQRPGLRLVAQGPAAPVRGLYRPSTGNGGYAVIGQNVYAIGANWALTQIGQLVKNATNPVSMIDNGVTLVLVDASTLGYQVNLGTNGFSQIVDPTGTFVGGTKVDYIDTFVLWGPVTPGANTFGSTLSNEITLDPTYVAGKTDYPDPLVTLIVNRHEIVLFGQLKSEIWYDAGNALFPFAELPGAYIEHGILAPYSAAAQDINVYWLGQDLQGQGVVYRQRGYETKRISNHALEYALRQASAGGASLSDAIGYCHQLDGHYFYVLGFASADMTWVFDEATQDWHQRGWSDANGVLHRDRSNCAAFINGTNVVGDWQNGAIYALDPNVYLDNGAPITFTRSFPHIGEATTDSGQPVPVDWRRQKLNGFWADIECGLAPADAGGNAAMVSLRISLDRGRTFGNAVTQSLGPAGAYLTQPQWRTLGIARDPVFELSYSVNGPAALNGGWIDTEALERG